MKAWTEDMIRQGIPAEHVMRYLDENPDKIISQFPPSKPEVDFLDSIIGPLIEPSPENLIALPLSFATGSIAGRLATKFLPSAGVRRLAVRFLTDPLARTVEFETAKKAGLEAAYGAIASIHSEGTFLKGLATSFGVSLPFAVRSEEHTS